MAAQPALEHHVAVPYPDRAFEVRRGEFLPDDGYGLVIDSPPLTIAAFAAITVMAGALMVFAVGEIAGRYTARPRGGAR